MIDSLESSLLRILIILSFSVLFYIFSRWRLLLLISASISALVFYSFLMEVGEVYSYSGWYKRAYWYFGDDLTTWMSPLFLYAVMKRWIALAACIAGALFMSGGRIGLLLLVIQLVFAIWLYRHDALVCLRSFAIALLGGILIYFGTLGASPYAIKTGNDLAILITGDKEYRSFVPTVRGYGNCRVQDCFETKIKRPLRIRALSAVGGLWMTLQGGFPGDRYPNTPEKFANLMQIANPWGINDKYNVSRAEWMKIATIQSPYLGFGAGYGPFLLLPVMAFIGAVALLGLRSLRRGPLDQYGGFTVFFIVNAIFNQTQAWLLPGPVLFVMGFCGTHILWQFLNESRSAQINL